MKRWLLALVMSGGMFNCSQSSSRCTGAQDCVAPQVCNAGTCTDPSLLNNTRKDGGIESDSGFITEPADGGPKPEDDAGVLVEPDAGINPEYDGGCGPPQPGNPSIRRLCAPATANECAGATDTALANGGVPQTRRNGAGGNGFDDDCDGQVDEGCYCAGAGTTKDCYLVPATQVAPSTGLPVGWCSANSKGSMECTGGEFGGWSGVCRGAQTPRLSDTCSAGDFNCDGLEKNNALEGCNCPVPITCPTSALTLAPYPDAKNLPLIDGSLWIEDAAKRASATNWKWTVVGGDCDNVLPFPTYTVYSQKDTTAANARIGKRATVGLDVSVSPPKYVPIAGEPLAAITASGTSKIYPAFGLSGDYIIQGEFSFEGKNYACTQKVQVRAPGIRAELCWDTVSKTDIDLHFARLQGISCSSQGWAGQCAQAPTYQDCNFLPASGCVSDSGGAPGWGYSNSPDTACFGWSSKRDPSGRQRCTNPRLDKDNVTCLLSMENPTDDRFCGPENINLDNPKNGDRFVVGVNHYNGFVATRPHVNVYCNGIRVLSTGFNPATGQTSHPLLNTPGQLISGDFWTVATIRANVNASNQLADCTVETLPSRVADPIRDGPAASNGQGQYCVDNGYSSKAFVENGRGQGLAPGSQPVTSTQWCKH